MNELNLLFSILIGLPVLGAVAAPLLRRRLLLAWAVGISAATATIACLTVGNLWNQPFRYAIGGLPWLKTKPPLSLFGFMLDPLSALMLAVITGMGFLVVLYSTEYLGPRNREHPVTEGQGRYYFWLLLFVAAMIGIVLSPNLFQLFIFWELTTLCSWALISFRQDAKALRAGFKALIITHIGGVLFMVALVIVFVASGGFEFGALGRMSRPLATTVFLLLLAAAWAKSAQLPFSTWLPDAMEAPTPISAYLHAAAMVKAGVYLVARLVIENSTISSSAGLVVALMAVLTMAASTFLYFFQDDLKRLLAYSTIAHLGYILLAASLGIFGVAVGFRGGLLHIVSHAAAKGLLFLTVGAVAFATGSKTISQLSGVGRRMPLAAVAFFVGVLAVTGVPPFACFWSKFFILTGALQLGGFLGIVLAVAVVAESLVAFGWFLYVGQRVFLGQPCNSSSEAKDPGWVMSAPLVLLILLTIAAPLLALPLLNLVMVGR